MFDRHPVEALQMLRHSEIDVALIFRYADAPAEEDGFRLVHVRDDPIYLVSRRPDDRLANHRDSAVDRRLRTVPGRADHRVPASRLHPAHRLVSDDMVVVQALVAAGVGVTTLPGLALQAHRRPDVHTTELDSRPAQDLRRHLRRAAGPTCLRRTHRSPSPLRLQRAGFVEF